MLSAIKVGDIYIVYDNNEMEEKSKWYIFGQEIAQYYKQFKRWLTKHKTTSKPQPKVVKLKIRDYSIYELPTVYRKWR